MRYKLIHFYLPLHHDVIDYRIKYFSLGETLKETDITTVRPGSTITGVDGVVYDNIPGTDVYESFKHRFAGRTKTDQRQRINWFIKVVEESDPLFNFDILGSVPLPYDDDDTLYSKCLDTISRVLPQFIGENILWIGLDD